MPSDIVPDAFNPSTFQNLREPQTKYWYDTIIPDTAATSFLVKGLMIDGS